MFMGIVEKMDPIFNLLPEVRLPEVKPAINKRLLWTAAVLVLFFAMGRVNVIGIDLAQSAGGQLQTFQLILASNIGTLITVGIGPIVLSSIILQLLVGTKIITMDLTNPESKKRFTSLQKLLAILLCIFEAFVYTFSGLVVAVPGMFVWVVLQITIGSILLLYLDEVVSKYGIGSGISMFIAGGVAADIFWRIFNPLDISRNFNLGEAQGLLFLIARSVMSGQMAETFIYLLPIIFTILVFLVVVFAEGIHVNIPITMGRKGAMSRYPVKLLYVSNIPVILAAAFFANIRLWSLLAKDVPVLGFALSGLSEIVNSPSRLIESMLLQGVSLNIFSEMAESVVRLQFIGIGGELIHGILYLLLLTVFCVIFGVLWIEMAGQGPEAVAAQLDKAGMSIPGFRRDPRIVRKVLDRYIPPISIMGSIFVGMLAGLADLTGALGTGTGILLTVGIVYRLYEELARLQLMDMHPMLSKLFG